MGKLSYDKLHMQMLWQVSHCLVYSKWLSHCGRLQSAYFLNSAQLPSFVRVTGNGGFRTKFLLMKRLHAQFVIRQFSN